MISLPKNRIRIHDENDFLRIHENMNFSKYPQFNYQIFFEHIQIVSVSNSKASTMLRNAIYLLLV